MGEIVGSALVAHVPPLVLPKDVRLELNHGRDFSIVDGLHRMRRECIDPLHADTIVVLDTHWFTTFEWVVSAHERRAGKFTSEELPRGNPQMPYDIVGDPQLARLVEQVAAERTDTWWRSVKCSVRPFGVPIGESSSSPVVRSRTSSGHSASCASTRAPTRPMSSAPSTAPPTSG